MRKKNEEVTVLVTGGSGFIGSALIRFLLNETRYFIINVDKLTYSSNQKFSQNSTQRARYKFVFGDICDESLISDLFKTYNPTFVMHLAAETHVDRSIEGPEKFIKSNIIGTSVMLNCALQYWKDLPLSKEANQKAQFDSRFSKAKKESFRFLHVSTDEVFGSVDTPNLFEETTPYDPSSPYSASKASADHLVRAWHRTYGLPVVITNCSNNFGPFQFPDKLIPLVITNALQGLELPIYGNGKNVRDWLYVEDHVRALYLVINEGLIGETYNIGGGNERSNLEVVSKICDLLDQSLLEQNSSKLMPIQKCTNGEKQIVQSGEILKSLGKKSFRDLILFVPDRLGHDKRYAINSSKIQKNLGWRPIESFETGMSKTLNWYINNQQWCNLNQQTKRSNRKKS